jgi:hypothetical protein
LIGAGVGVGGLTVGTEVLEDTLGRILGNALLGIPVVGRSLGDTLGNEVIGISLGYAEGESLEFSIARELGEVLGPDDGT